MPQQLNHLILAVVHIHQVLMAFTDLVADSELLIPVLLAHVLRKVFEVTTRNIDHLLLTDWLADALRLDFCARSLVLHALFTVKTCVLFAVLLLRISMLKFWRYIFFVSIIICLLQVCDVLLILEVEKCRVVMLLKILLGRFVLCLLLDF